MRCNIYARHVMGKCSDLGLNIRADFEYGQVAQAEWASESLFVLNNLICCRKMLVWYTIFYTFPNSCLFAKHLFRRRVSLVCRSLIEKVESL